MTTTHVARPASVEDATWQTGAQPVAVTCDADGRLWTDEDIRAKWRRIARTRMRKAFAASGYSAAVADEVVFTMQRVMTGYRGPGEPRTSPVPFYWLAWDGAEEGFMQAWDCPVDPQDPIEDDAPTWASQHAAYDQSTRAPLVAALRSAVFCDSLNRPPGAAA